MAKSRAKKVPKKIFPKIILVLGFLLVVAVSYWLWPKPQPSGIFVVGTGDSLSYGNTELTGVLRKDSPVGRTGNYLLVLSSGRPIVLDVKGLDQYLGYTIKIKGLLTPAVNSADTAHLRVAEVTIQ